MKTWQKGFDIEYLKNLEKRFNEYNRYSLSPFSVVKKNTIAEGLYNKTLFIEDECVYERKISKVKTPISMHGKIFFAQKLPNDITFSKIVGNISNILEKENDNIWIFDFLDRNQDFKDFVYIGTKITTYGELIGVWYKGSNLKERLIQFDPLCNLGIAYVGTYGETVLNLIKEKLNDIPEFTNHYSNYNTKKTWSALSLRGYSNDPKFITKPSEMNDKWKKEHENENFFLQDTSLYDKFDFLKYFLKNLFGDVEIHRIRFMKLKANNEKNSELGRHTDIVDVDSGFEEGKLIRFHFPIITHDSVIFTVWKPNGQKIELNMKENHIYALDTRKPHMVTNPSNIDRIHLVIDVISNEKLRNMLHEI